MKKNKEIAKQLASDIVDEYYRMRDQGKDEEDMLNRMIYSFSSPLEEYLDPIPLPRQIDKYGIQDRHSTEQVFKLSAAEILKRFKNNLTEKEIEMLESYGK